MKLPKQGLCLPGAHRMLHKLCASLRCGWAYPAARTHCPVHAMCSLLFSSACAMHLQNSSQETQSRAKDLAKQVSCSPCSWSTTWQVQI